MNDGNMVNVELKMVSSSTSRKEDDPAMKENLSGFLPLLGTAQILGLLPIILLIYWTFSYAGGLGLGPSNVFNWHPILLSISFIYLTGNGILAFRIMREKPKNSLKLIHAGVKGLNSLLAIIGVWAAFQHHFNNNIPNLYTIHSWIGLLTLIAYLAQAVMGFLAYLYPGFSPTTRALLMPYHRFAGQTLLALSVVAVISGINEKAIFKLGNAYGQKGVETILLNLSGLLIVLFSIVVIYLSSNLDYKRYPRAVDSGLQDRTR